MQIQHTNHRFDCKICCLFKLLFLPNLVFPLNFSTKQLLIKKYPREVVRFTGIIINLLCTKFENHPCKFKIKNFKKKKEKKKIEKRSVRTRDGVGDDNGWTGGFASFLTGDGEDAGADDGAEAEPDEVPPC